MHKQNGKNNSLKKVQRIIFNVIVVIFYTDHGYLS